jgi:hypothetical protein
MGFEYLVLQPIKIALRALHCSYKKILYLLIKYILPIIYISIEFTTERYLLIKFILLKDIL